MTNQTFYHFIIFLLSLSSISYELILAQSLSAFLENTILRYSVTIGLYMCSIGVGSLFAGEKWVCKSVLNLLKIEIGLTILGGFSVAILFLTDVFNIGRAGFLIMSHALIIAIGFLSGFEIPLLVKIAGYYKKSPVNQVLAINYAGAFCGTLLFAFYLYPRLGLLPAAFFIGIVNAVSGLFLYFEEKQVDIADQKVFYLILYLLGFLFLILSLCVIYGDLIHVFFMKQYLSK